MSTEKINVPEEESAQDAWILENQQFLEKTQAKYKKLSKNSVAYLSTLDLPRHITANTPEQQDKLREAAKTIAQHHPVLAGLTFESETCLTDTLEIDQDTIALINGFMEQHGFSIGALSNYGANADLKNTMHSVVKEAGTARTDVYRAQLDKTLLNVTPDHKALLPVETPLMARSKNNRFSWLLSKLNLQQKDQSGQLTLKFEASAEFKAEIQDANLTSEEITHAINGSLKRSVRRAFIQASEIAHPTDSEAAKRYDAITPSQVTLSESGDKVEVDVVVPLTGAVQWAFENDVIDAEKIEDLQEKLALAVIRGTRLASHLKVGVPDEYRLEAA